ncbi:MAG: energy-coupling factor transporter ATPase [Kiritimatiellae bacterium]|nr:energy-coupling factor transporter ATPase [Kiritimatiellia bacterium]
MTILRLENLCHVYGRGTPFEKKALNGVSLDLLSGQYTALIGHTGSGKSTLIQHMNGLLKPSDGRVFFEGEDIFRSKEATHNTRFQVGLVFQYPEHQLFEETVWRDIAFGPGNMGLRQDEIDERVREAADFTGIPEELFGASPLELSGGQKRRVAIAGVIAMRPRLLILDEPTAGLDPAGCADILDNMDRYHRETGAAILLVTHSMEEAARRADRLLVLSEGKIVMDGLPNEVFSHAEKLRGMGLDIPAPTLLALRLRELGVPVSPSVFTAEQLRDELLALRKGDSLC